MLEFCVAFGNFSRFIPLARPYDSSRTSDQFKASSVYARLSEESKEREPEWKDEGSRGDSWIESRTRVHLRAPVLFSCVGYFPIG